MNILTGILIPFIGTTAGAACVFFLKDQLRPVVQKTLLGFASGVMVAASVWSLFHSRKNLCIISPPHCFLQEKFLTVQYIQNAEKVLIIFLKWINNLQSITVR